MNSENLPVFDEVMCRLRWLIFLAHPVNKKAVVFCLEERTCQFSAITVNSNFIFSP